MSSFFTIAPDASRITVAERHLLELLAHDGDIRKTVIPTLEESDYRDLATAEIFECLISLESQNSDVNAETLAELLPDEDAADLAHEILSAEPKREEGDADKVLHEAENCVVTLRQLAISNRILEISRDAAAAEVAGDTIAVQELIHEQLDLEKIRRELARHAAAV